MCGIAGIAGVGWNRAALDAMVGTQRHRGPDADGFYVDPAGAVGLGHNRLSIIDLSPAGLQPMVDTTGRRVIVFNGEIYNYLELRRELEGEYEFRTRTDTEVLLAAHGKWGRACLDKLIGMFAFAIWDERTQTLFAARDRFGVKPFYYYHDHAAPRFMFASEIKALHAAGLPAAPDPRTWATYLATGYYEQKDHTFWQDVQALPAGHWLDWRHHTLRVGQWYDLSEHVGQDFDIRDERTVEDEYVALLTDSMRLRFRSDVPVGVNLSGGLDSSVLLGIVKQLQVEASEVTAFTFVTGDARYDELPFVQRMLATTGHPSVICQLSASEVPALAESVQTFEDEPFGGLPTLAYARLFERAREAGTIVLLDGHGLDEQWAGYDYYADGASELQTPAIQASSAGSLRPQCLTPEFTGLVTSADGQGPFRDRLRNLQWRDATRTKIPRSLRFNDRISMRASTELREPFLDHRLFELALRQPADRKISDGVHKRLLRKIANRLLPGDITESPKRPIQTPQREWLRGELREWASTCIEDSLARYGGSWLNASAVRAGWKSYQQGREDNSFFVWQWISLALISGVTRTRQQAASPVARQAHKVTDSSPRRPGVPKVVVLASMGWALRDWVASDFLSALTADAEAVVVSPEADFLKEHVARPRVTFEWMDVQQLGRLRQELVRAITFGHYYSQYTRIQQRHLHRSLDGWALKSRLREYTVRATARHVFKRMPLGATTRIERACLGLVPEMKRLEQVFNAHRPDVVFSTMPLLTHYERPALWAAQRLGIPTACMITSWDNLHSKGRLPLDFAHYLVWSQRMHDDLLALYPKIDPKRVTIVGAPQFDFYRRPDLLRSRADFIQSIGGDPSRPLILWSGASQNQVPNEPALLELLCQAARNNRIRGNAQILLRPHPGGGGVRFADVIARYPELLFTETNIKEPTYLIHWTPLTEEMALLVNSIAHCDVSINHCSTMTLDCCALDKPVVNLAFDHPHGTPLEDYMRNCYTYEHYQSVVDSHATRIAYDLDELVAYVNRYLENPALEHEGRANVLRHQCGDLDGSAARRAAACLLEVASRSSAPSHLARPVRGQKEIVGAEFGLG